LRQLSKAILTIAFIVSVPRQEAIVNLNNQIESNRYWLSQELNISALIIKPMGIGDVPVMAFTLFAS
jgi:hypothetical protein